MKIEIEYFGIDDFNRPVFKAIDKNLFFGDTDHLFAYGTDFKKIKNFYNNFEDISKHLIYFGNRFNCEPLGGDLVNIEFIVKEK